jgi:hypothetical protein
MNRLEEYIRDNKSLFDEEPPAGHFERMQQKMSRKSGKIIALRWSISIAASIAVLLTAGVIWQNAGKQNDRIILCENVSDMKICYLDRMYEVAGQIERLVTDFDPWDQQQVLDDVQNIIDTVSDDFESEIPEELPDDMAKAILSDYYRQNLESLEMIVELISD